MKKFLTAAGLACGLAMTTLAQPAAAEVPLTLNAGVGYWHFDSARNLDDNPTPFAGLEWAFNDLLAIEALATYNDTGFSDERPGDVDVAAYQIGLLFYAGSYIGAPKQVRPYVTFGMGKLDFDSDPYDSRESTLHLGAGARWMVTPRVGMRFEARGMNSLDTHDTDLLMSVGLNWYFGKVEDDMAASAMSGGAVASGDEDGDGVLDVDDRCPGTPAGTRVGSDGCPLPVTRVASIKMTVNFAFDSSVVQEKYFNDISELAAFLKRFEDVYVDIEGHTDSVGPDDYNMALSQRRAGAVVDVLVNQYGIDRRRLEPKGYGETQPVADNASAEGRAENRRVMATLEVEYED
ncbi:OmpA family protein [Mangrovimicrobium sediminis]|uniref:OmpA family protein n=1 Tax=Mangrovimicrobium sediminis TaxID=2562682 RepID=A0A4Z0LVT1_9GAMM|nr:OmpA family protein [Haliea sp. SAOS-164]TGD71165.1 OmpA family protein [Haliea sp. SAOS-164]